MTRKKRRIVMLIWGAVALALSSFLVVTAMRDSIVFFLGPSEALAKGAAGEIAPDRLLRVGGLVEGGSLEREADGSVRFLIADGTGALPVSFNGLLPDLFDEGQGAVAEGFLRGGVLQAEEILAKHDENYIPREVVEELKRTGRWREGEELGKAGIPQE